MVQKITLLEPHFEGAQFGPSSFESDAPDALTGIDTEKSDTGDESSGSTSRATMLVQGLIGFVLMFIVLYVSLRVLTADEGEDA